MGESGINILLIGENQNGCWQLAKRLEERGCRWRFACTLAEAQSLLARYEFRVVLSTRPAIAENPVRKLFTKANSHVFFSCPVEDGCLWFQAIDNGEDCLRMPALCPSEFIGVLEKIVAKEISAKGDPAEGSVVGPDFKLRS